MKSADWQLATEEQRTRVDADVFQALCQVRDHVDAQLGRWLEPIEAAVHSGEGLGKVAAEMVETEIQENHGDDRWFGGIVDTLDLCFHALQGNVDENEIEQIAERSFSSWIAPEKDAIQQFADDLAALSMRSQFRKTYGGGASENPANGANP